MMAVSNRPAPAWIHSPSDTIHSRPGEKFSETLRRHFSPKRACVNRSPLTSTDSDVASPTARAENVKRDSGQRRRCLFSVAANGAGQDHVSIFRRRDRTDTAGDQAIMLDAAMAGKIEDGVLAEHRGVEIAGMKQQFVAFS